MTSFNRNHVLVTGFRPFNNRDVNGAETVARALHGIAIAGFQVESRLINVVWGDVDRFCAGSLPRTRARMVLCLGEAGRPTPSFEQLARPQVEGDDVLGHDASGALDGLPATPTRLRFDSTWFTRPETAPQLSDNAGAYLCNYIMMRGLHTCPVPLGFLHLPVQGKTPDDEYLVRYEPVARTLIENNVQTLT